MYISEEQIEYLKSGLETVNDVVKNESNYAYACGYLTSIVQHFIEQCEKNKSESE